MRTDEEMERGTVNGMQELLLVWTECVLSGMSDKRPMQYSVR